jgi:hypothetical protein
MAKIASEPARKFSSDVNHLLTFNGATRRWVIAVSVAEGKTHVLGPLEGDRFKLVSAEEKNEIMEGVRAHVRELRRQKDPYPHLPTELVSKMRVIKLPRSQKEL